MLHWDVPERDGGADQRRQVLSHSGSAYERPINQDRLLVGVSAPGEHVSPVDVQVAKSLREAFKQLEFLLSLTPEPKDGVHILINRLDNGIVLKQAQPGNG